MDSFALLRSMAAWAIVPPYPNELTPPVSSSSAATRRSPLDCTGSPHRTAPSASLTCGFSDRSCAFATDCCRSSSITSCTNPVRPAAGSACPMHAFTPPTPTVPHAPPRWAITATASDRASIGSPSAVPVPCASATTKDCAVHAPSTSEARNKLFCACPLGAVRLAERPSCRTAQPTTPTAAS
eukprot:5648153-Prymnesium_polylepis.2